MYAEEKELASYLRKISSQISLSNQDIRSANNNNNTHADGASTKPMLLIDTLHEMERKGEMSRERVHDQILTFLMVVSAQNSCAI